jgi:hypothetical protein
VQEEIDRKKKAAQEEIQLKKRQVEEKEWKRK